YQSRQLFADYGIPVPTGKIATTPEQAVEAARTLGGEEWVVKAQIHAGGRGKAGGVKLVKTLDDVKAAAAKMLGTNMATYQSGGRALPVNVVLISEANTIAKELYLSVLVDRATKAVAFIASARGGVDIEQVARENPEDIHTLEVNFVQGLQPYQCRSLAFAMGLNAKQANQLTKIMLGLYKLFNEKDLSLVEVNPLAILASGDLVALDGKVNSDDNAEFRHADLAAMRDESQEDHAEAIAVKHNLNYVTMDGHIGCMVHGGGTAMATMDVIKLAGGEPANFPPLGAGAVGVVCPRARRWCDEEARHGSIQADPVVGQGALHPDQHFRRHRSLRHDRRGHHRRGRGSRADDSGRRAPRGHERREGPRAVGEFRFENNAGA